MRLNGESRNIYQSIAAAMGDVTPILKRKTNDEQQFKYRGVDDVMNAVQPILKKNKIFPVPEILEIIREKLKNSDGGGLIFHTTIKIKYTFYAIDGSNINATVAGEAMDTGDKSLSKAESIAYRIALCQVFCIPTNDGGIAEPDGDTYKLSANGTQTSGKVQEKTTRTASNWTIVKDAIKNTTVTMPEVETISKERYKTSRLNNLSPEQLKDLLAAIKEKAAEKAAGH